MQPDSPVSPSSRPTGVFPVSQLLQQPAEGGSEGQHAAGGRLAASLSPRSPRMPGALDGPSPHPSASPPGSAHASRASTPASGRSSRPVSPQHAGSVPGSRPASPLGGGRGGRGGKGKAGAGGAGREGGKGGKGGKRGVDASGGGLTVEEWLAVAAERQRAVAAGARPGSAAAGAGTAGVDAAGAGAAGGAAAGGGIAGAGPAAEAPQGGEGSGGAPALTSLGLQVLGRVPGRMYMQEHAVLTQRPGPPARHAPQTAPSAVQAYRCGAGAYCRCLWAARPWGVRQCSHLPCAALACAEHPVGPQHAPPPPGCFVCAPQAHTHLGGADAEALEAGAYAGCPPHAAPRA